VADSIVSDFLTESVNYRPRAGRDISGNVTHGAARTLRARVERRNTWVLTAEGRIRDETTYVLVEERVDTGDEMDTGDGNGWRPVDAVEDVKSAEGEFWGTECYL
jgi:hypothetical protein